MILHLRQISGSSFGLTYSFYHVSWVGVTIKTSIQMILVAHKTDGLGKSLDFCLFIISPRSDMRFTIV